MKLVEEFTKLAAKAEGNLANLAFQQDASLQRREALQQIEERFRQMEADGTIDDQEMAELMQMLSAHQLDTSTLQQLYTELKGTDSSVRGDDGETFADAVNDLLTGAIDETRDNQSDLQFAIQLEAADMTNYGFAASQLSKQEHQVYMNIIANMKA